MKLKYEQRIGVDEEQHQTRLIRTDKDDDENF